MKEGGEVGIRRLIIGALVMVAFSVVVLVIAPYFLTPQVVGATAPRPYSDMELRGRQVYIANGCVYCHSQQPRDPSLGPDMQRGWGRPSVPQDYAHDKPHLLGTMRTGPDLLNIAVRQPSKDWHLGHLYAPRAYLPGSIMPAFPFLFELRTGSAKPGEQVVQLPPGTVPDGVTVIAKPEALDLVAYLLSLDRTYPVDPAAAGGDR